MNVSDQNVEIEIKLRLGSFTDYLKLLGFVGNVDSEEQYLNCFFDSEDRSLYEAGWACRVRIKSKTGLVTVKGLPKESGMATIRPEIETEIPRGSAVEIVNLQADILDLDIEPVNFIKTKFPGIRPAKIVDFKTTRQKKSHQIGDYRYTLEIDKTEFADGSVDYELEVELAGTEQIVTVENGLQKLFSSLAIPFEKETECKYLRALKRARLY
jgi:uncharacterized protein YjbK